MFKIINEWNYFIDVAMKASDANLNQLAELLLDKETCLKRQVEMLMKLNKIDRALAKAAKSQQPDLRKYAWFFLTCLISSAHWW